MRPAVDQASAAAAGAFQFRLIGFTISPMRMAFVETLIRQMRPSMTARTRWIFGLNLRLVLPVTLVPTPPRYLALPRWVYCRPLGVRLPVK